jgi:hypothetical protein
MNIDWTQIIVTIISALVILWQGRRTHNTFNSKMDKMLKMNKKASFAAGRKAEKDSK